MAKRGNSEGSITKRGDGRWEARITLPGGGRRSLYARTRQEAARRLAEALRDRDRGLPVVPEKQTLAEYLAQWLKAVRGSVRFYTYTAYEVYVRVHIVPILGGLKVARLGAQDLQSLYAQKLAQGLSPTTVSHIHSTLHRALEQALRWGVVLRNVAEMTDPPRRACPQISPLSPDEARALLAAAAGDPLEALYVLAVTTGMRQGELLGLRWQDVDLDGGTLKVQVAWQRRDRAEGGYALVEPKTASGRRQIALTSMGVAALGRHRVHQAEERLATGPAWENNDLVFCNSLGRPVGATNLRNRSFQPLLKRAGLPRIRFHDLRHTAATLFLGQRVPAKVVSEMLGHSRIGITLDTYSHVLPNMQREAVAAMEGLLG